MLAALAGTYTSYGDPTSVVYLTTWNYVALARTTLEIAHLEASTICHFQPPVKPFFVLSSPIFSRNARHKPIPGTVRGRLPRCEDQLGLVALGNCRI